MVKMKQPLLLLSIAAITFFLNACTGLVPIQFSKPVFPEANIRMSKNGIISLPGLDLKVVPRNEDYPFILIGFIVPIIPIPSFLFSPDRPQFEILLVLDPKGEDFALDPGSIVLQISGKPAIPPVGFKRGPGAFTSENGGILLSLGKPPGVSCNVDSHSNTVPIPVSPIPVLERTCFLLTFNIRSPLPEKEFTLFIDGVTKAGQSFPIPPIHFKKGWTLEFDFGVPI